MAHNEAEARAPEYVYEAQSNLPYPGGIHWAGYFLAEAEPERQVVIRPFDLRASPVRQIYTTKEECPFVRAFVHLRTNNF